MLLRLLYDDALAQASYLIGCQATGEAIIIDPERDVDRYLAVAKQEGLRLVAAAETHIHADFLSGSRELAAQGVKVYLSAEGGPDWQYQWPGEYKHQLLRDNDAFNIGNIRFRVLHTPGHTPEHICFEVTDLGGGARSPWASSAATSSSSVTWAAPTSSKPPRVSRGLRKLCADQLFASVQQFVKLPDYLQVWPGHGAGSACGKALRRRPTDHRRLRNPLQPRHPIRNPQSEVRSRLHRLHPQGPTRTSDLLRRMKRLNRDGPQLLGKLPTPREIPALDLATLDFKRAAILDTRVWSDFKAGHLPGALRDPLDRTFNTIAASYASDDQDIYVVASAAQVNDAVRALVRVGLDRIIGFIEPATIKAYASSGGKLESTPEVDINGAKEVIASGALVLDVRRKADEFDHSHIPGAVNIPHLRLAAHLKDLPRDRKILVHCAVGSRSSRAVTLLQREGFDADQPGRRL